MNEKDKLRAAEELLIKRGWDADGAKQMAKEALDEGEPLLETLCFYTLAEHVLATIHDSSWIKYRAEHPDCDGHDVIKRLVQSGASADDLALFARLMQREYLGNLGCILDGAGVVGTPDLPYEDFRIFAVRTLDTPDEFEPGAPIKELHESLGFSDWQTEIRLSREAEVAFEREREENRKRRDREK
ncbi:MAG TPA: hypothetical protein VF306_13370 [Pirellulales bacterium]